MVNWTDFSKGLEGTWKDDGKRDLPVPYSKDECESLIEKTEEILEVFGMNDLSLDNYLVEHRAEGVDILSWLQPRDVSIGEYPVEWEDRLKMWKFEREILHKVMDRNYPEISYLKACVDVYHALLEEKLMDFGEGM